MLITPPACKWSNVRPLSDLGNIALGALARMYRPAERLFAFRIRRTKAGDVLEGVSRRYTAMALIGLAGEAHEVAREILAGQTCQEICGGLIASLGRSEDLGEVALTLWAARALGHADAAGALDRLRAMDPAQASVPTVELAWSLTALVCEKPTEGLPWAQLADTIANRLLASFCERSAMFPHWPVGARSPFLRRHVTCFADLVYPIQALSLYHVAADAPPAFAAASRCAERMCSLQGPAGQWWWHYDVRTGRVIEGYPVYSVHQDAMAPMALQALRAAGGPDHAAAIDRGLAWLAYSPEIAGSLIDPQAGLIWRKVARREPGKFSRTVQALASRIHPSARVPGLGLTCHPGAIDYESRPYHMGWILYAWPAGQGDSHAGACVSVCVASADKAEALTAGPEPAPAVARACQACPAPAESRS